MSSSSRSIATLLVALAAAVPFDAGRADEAIKSVELVLDPQGFLGAIFSLDFSPDGRWIAAAGEFEVRIWNVETSELKATLRGDRNDAGYGVCYCVAFSPSGKELLVGISDASRAGSLRVYDTANFDEMKELVAGHADSVRRLAFSRDGRYLVSAGGDGQLRIWDWPQRRVLKVVPPAESPNPLPDVLVFPSSEAAFLSIGDQAVVYSAPEGVAAASANALPPRVAEWFGTSFQFPHDTPPKYGDFQLEKNAWAGAYQTKVGGVWKYWCGAWNGGEKPAAVYEGHRWEILAVALSADGELVATGDQLGEVHLWKLRTGERVHRLRACGAPVYEAGFEQDDARIAFGNVPSAGSEWKLNRRGDALRVFDLKTRSFATTDGASHTQERTQSGGKSVASHYENEAFSVRTTLNGVPEGAFALRTGAMPTALTMVASPLASKYPVVVADAEGVLLGIDPATDWNGASRFFAGHNGFITSVSEADSSKYLITSSTDRTVRIWPLSEWTPAGWFDFRIMDGKVLTMRPESASSKAGVQVGDRVISVNSLSLQRLRALNLAGEPPFRPEERVKVRMERAGREYEYELPLAEGYDTVKPLLSIFFGNDDEWIMWTPEGYYDASPGADRLIGFHANRGPDRSALFFSAGQFKETLYRPDVIDRVLETGDAKAANLLARTARPGGARSGANLSEPATLEQSRPPEIRILEPFDGDRFEASMTKVKVAVKSPNGLPVRQVSVLVNGTPLAPQEPKGAAGAEEVFEFDVQLEPGRNVISALASNAASRSETESVQVACDGVPVDQVRKPNLYALAIGVSKYRHLGAEAGVRELQFAHKDAEAFVEMVEAQRGGPLYASVNTRLLTNESADRAGFYEGFEWLRTNAVQGDVVMLFVSSHGFRDARQTYYFGTHDIKPDNLAANGISSEELQRLLEQDLPPCKRILFIDTCHSGGATGFKGTFDPAHDLATDETGTILFASCLPREPSLELNEREHGAFTFALLETLRNRESDGDPRDGLLLTSELQSNIAKRVKQFTGGNQHPAVHVPPTIREFNLFQIVTN